jgi:hypothetical protein
MDETLLTSQHALYASDISRVQKIGAAQLTLTLRRHLGKDVALVSVFVLEAACRFLEALLRPAMGFHFWHG